MMFPLIFIQTVRHLITVFYAYVTGAVGNDIRCITVILFHVKVQK